VFVIHAWFSVILGLPNRRTRPISVTCPH
jgi:hypothetical protein